GAPLGREAALGVHLLEPLAPDARVAAGGPHLAERVGEPKARAELAARVDAPSERGPDVVVLGLEPDGRAPQRRARPFRRRVDVSQDPVSVAPEGLRLLTRRAELLAG